MIGALAFIAFVGTIPAANWFIQNVGTNCVPDGPCLVPVWPGIDAPSGVLMVGLAFTLRDVVHRLWGARPVLAAIILGGALSGFLAPSTLVVASIAAFAASELLDFAVYAPLQRRRFLAAVVASNTVGIIADSALFLWLAFGSLDHLAGNVIGKAWMTLAVLPIVWAARHHLPMRSTKP